MIILLVRGVEAEVELLKLVGHYTAMVMKMMAYIAVLLWKKNYFALKAAISLTTYKERLGIK